MMVAGQSQGNEGPGEWDWKGGDQVSHALNLPTSRGEEMLGLTGNHLHFRASCLFRQHVELR